MDRFLHQPKKASGKIRQLNRTQPKKSQTSSESPKSRSSDVLGMKIPGRRGSSPTLRFSKHLSVNSASSASSADTEASYRSPTSARSSASAGSRSSFKSLTDFDRFGAKAVPTEKELAPPCPDAVELQGNTYRVPQPIDKEFYRDLTCLEDEEIIRKHGLIQVCEDKTRERKSDGNARK